MTQPYDVNEETSEALSTLIRKVLDDRRIVQPATLAHVRKQIMKGIKTETVPLNRFSGDKLQELCDEIDYMIEEYGEDSLAVHFMKPRASQVLTVLIDAGVDRLGEPTLAQLFDELEKGLLAEMAGRGEIDVDDEQTVIAELQSLMELHGGDALAEEFARSP